MIHFEGLIRKSNRLGWTKEHTLCVQNLKEECVKLPKLRLPEPEENLVLQIDAFDNHWEHYYKQI